MLPIKLLGILLMIEKKLSLLIFFCVISISLAESSDVNNWNIDLSSTDPLVWEIKGGEEPAWFSVRHNGKFDISRDETKNNFWHKGPTSQGNSTIEFVTIGRKTTQALQGLPQSWSGESIYYRLLDCNLEKANTIIIKADIAVVGFVHQSWPLSNHIVFNGATLGMTGDKISYGTYEDDSISKFKLNEFDEQVSSDKWYQIKIVCSRSKESFLCEYYYRDRLSDEWTKSPKTVEIDKIKDNKIFVISNNNTNPGVIDNIEVSVPDCDYTMKEDFESYLAKSIGWQNIPPLLNKKGAFEFVSSSKGSFIVSNEIKPLKGNNNFLIECVGEKTGEYKKFEFNIFDPIKDVANDNLSAFGSESVIELSEGWLLSDLKCQSTPPQRPSHQKKPVVDRKFNSVKVPGNWHDQFPEVYPEAAGKNPWSTDYGFEHNPVPHYIDGWYKCSLKTPILNNLNDTVKLRFLSIAYESHIFVNNRFVEMHKGSFSPFEIDITNYLNAQGQPNEILIWVCNDFGEKPPKHVYGSMFSYGHNLGGIEGPVFLKVSPLISLYEVRADSEISKQAVNISGKIEKQFVKNFNKEMFFVRLFNASGESIKCDFKVSVSEDYFQIRLNASNLKLWTLDNPELYDLHIILNDGNAVLAHSVTQFGYRQFEVRGDKFYLNGRPVKLYFGNVFTGTSDRCDLRFGYENLYYDIKRQKEYGCNAMRFHMARDAYSVLNVTDNAGIILMYEFPIFHRVFSGIPDYNDRMAYLENVLPEQRESMYMGYNHASLLLWCMSNEVWNNNLKELYEGFYAQAKEIESGTRPICPVSGLNSFGVPSYQVPTDWFDDHNYDSYKLCPTLLYKSIEKRKTNIKDIYGKVDKPWIVSEFQSSREAKQRVILDPQAKYIDEYLKNSENGLLRDVTLKDMARFNFYSYYMNTVGLRVYEVFCVNSAFQGLHPWYGDRSSLPEYFKSLTKPYKVILNPIHRNVHWFRDADTEINLVIAKDVALPLNAKLKVNVVRFDNAEKLLELQDHCSLGKSDNVLYKTINIKTTIPNGKYQLIIELFDDEDILLNSSLYDVWVMDKNNVTLNPNIKVGYIGLGDKASLFKKAAEEFDNLIEIRSFDELSSINHLIIGADALQEAERVLEASKVKRWLNDGGRMLILEQHTSSDISFLPGYKIKCNDSVANIFADFLIEDHPALKGLSRDMFRDFADNDNLVNRSVLIPLNNNAILASANNTVLFDAIIGKGEILVSLVETLNLQSQDPVAHRYMNNLLDYFINQTVDPNINTLNVVNIKTFDLPDNLQWNMLPIEGYANRRTSDQQGNSVIGLLDLGALDLRHMPVGIHKFHSIPFNLLKPDVNNVLVLQGPQLPNLSANVGPILLNATATYLSFLHTCYGDAEEKIFVYRIKYSDGTEVDVPVTGRKQIGDWYAPSNGTECFVAWAEEHPVSGVELGFYIYLWQNPKPELKINSVEIIKISENGTPMIFAISYAKGSCANLSDSFNIKDFIFEPAELKLVKDESLKLSNEAPSGWSGGTVLKGLQTLGLKGGTAAVGSLLSGSLVLKYGDIQLKQDKDYIIETEWGSLGVGPNSIVTSDDLVTACYSYSLLRVDSVIELKTGKRVVVKGESHLTTPEQPQIPTDSKRICNVLIPYRSDGKRIEIYPISNSEKTIGKTSRGMIPKTIAKIKAGEPVKIVCWGDSVTAGGDATCPEKAYTKVFEKLLSEKFPELDFTIEVIAESSTNSRQWLYPEEHPTVKSENWWNRVLDGKPDLVTIEFVNDAYLNEKKLFEETYNEILTRLKNINAEVIFIIPHFTKGMPNDSDNRSYVEYLKEFADKNGVALADVSNRWKNMYLDGLPYITFLRNGYNHPDDRGHEIYAEELLKCFE